MASTLVVLILLFSVGSSGDEDSGARLQASGVCSAPMPEHLRLMLSCHPPCCHDMYSQYSPLVLPRRPVMHGPCQSDPLAPHVSHAPFSSAGDPCVCATVYEPVCANNNTFSSACEASCLGLQVWGSARNGLVQRSEALFNTCAVYDLVMVCHMQVFSDYGIISRGSPSGGILPGSCVTLNVITAMSLAPSSMVMVLQVQHVGECELPPHCLKCSEEYTPVCGVDKLTYVNPCVAECSRVAVLKAGVCSKTLVIKPQQSGKRGSLGARRQLAGEASVAAGWRRRLMHHP